MKHCSSCKKDLPLTEFWKNKAMKGGYQWWCTTCWKAVTDKRRNGPKREVELRQRRNRHLIRKYGITADEYDTKLKKQNGVCGICMLDRDSRNFLAVDHNHDTGVIRGLLCENCNRGLGMFKDNKEFLQNAIHYL